MDAARTGDAPGSVVVFEDDEMDRYLTGNRQSVHEVGLVDLLDIARLSDHYPAIVHWLALSRRASTGESSLRQW